MNDDKLTKSLARQAWIGLAAWLAFGLFLEGLIAFRSPAYLQLPLRRELFRLAHAHGAALSLIVLAAAVAIKVGLTTVPKVAVRALQTGALLMPLGFLLGGLKVTETDPNVAVFLAPAGGLLVIFAIVAAAVASFGDDTES